MWMSVALAPGGRGLAWAKGSTRNCGVLLLWMNTWFAEGEVSVRACCGRHSFGERDGVEGTVWDGVAGMV
jgi:hypothetical protein